MKILAAIDIMAGKVVRLTKGQETNKIIYSDDPVQIARRWISEGADMLHLVDLDAALDSQYNNLAIIEEILKSVNIPVQIGGGLRSEEAIENMFEIGAFRVVIGTLAYRKPNVIRKLVNHHPDRTVISLDQIGGIVMVKGWKSPTEYNVRDAMSKYYKMGITNFLLTSIERDGTLEGPDIETINHVCSDPMINVIASGGISSLMDIIRLKAMGCKEVILGKALYEGKIELQKVKLIT